MKIVSGLVGRFVLLFFKGAECACLLAAFDTASDSQTAYLCKIASEHGLNAVGTAKVANCKHVSALMGVGGAKIGSSGLHLWVAKNGALYASIPCDVTDAIHIVARVK